MSTRNALANCVIWACAAGAAAAAAGAAAAAAARGGAPDGAAFVATAASDAERVNWRYTEPRAFRFFCANARASRAFWRSRSRKASRSRGMWPLSRQCFLRSLRFLYITKRNAAHSTTQYAQKDEHN